MNDFLVINQIDKSLLVTFRHQTFTFPSAYYAVVEQNGILYIMSHLPSCRTFVVDDVCKLIVNGKFFLSPQKAAIYINNLEKFNDCECVCKCECKCECNKKDDKCGCECHEHNNCCQKPDDHEHDDCKKYFLKCSPHTWKPDEEYDFEDGSFGKRFVGKTDIKHNSVNNVELKLSNIDFVAFGGWFGLEDNIKSAIGCTFYKNAGNISFSSALVVEKTLLLQIYSTTSVNDAPFDFWVIYTKK